MTNFQRNLIRFSKKTKLLSLTLISEADYLQVYVGMYVVCVETCVEAGGVKLEAWFRVIRKRRRVEHRRRVRHRSRWCQTGSLVYHLARRRVVHTTQKKGEGWNIGEG